ncbi:MAG: class I SAM-dependent methyltransferase [Bacteroidetes bacterium]|nr:MAG: class I SAM-dependent methyltransferase [Bacteroidota bacterium]
MKDLFSQQSELYARYRPTYPQELLTFIISLINERRNAWDCGTGNGQLAVELARYFNTVHATDLSENQIKNAAVRKNIIYKVEPAEKTTFQDGMFDLITVAQAIHWFNFDAFYHEVNRTLKQEGVIAVVGYYLPTIDTAIDTIVHDFYKHTVGAYWDSERRYIDELYRAIPFPFQEIPSPAFQSKQRWKREQLIGFLNSWSAVQHYINRNKKNPVELIVKEINNVWNEDEFKEVNFPILLRVGRKGE